MYVVGIDPGAKHTGIVLRSGDRLIEGAVLVREDGSGLDPPSPGYLSAVISMITEIVASASPGVIAMEEATRPSGFSRDGERQPITPGSLIGLGAVIGAVMSNFDDVVMVPTAAHGDQPLSLYPSSLVSDRERVKGAGTGMLRHARSAWDVAGAALGVLRRQHALQRSGVVQGSVPVRVVKVTP